ncbi:N-acetylmuramoyl-L-alanine amidase [Finegoldia magna]|uniref:N-acetylmuramoyl-L-alanine amidase n=1 Tax=Finegoldia magna TaxID=1260 RepID=A0A233V7Z1_FINMA|nr:cell wall-binding repeat-containing protein [Finegoldia magna]OXZ28494.1 N-acetylmuramoyl-L-alanine amidase [Finegoldia magna]
MNNIKKPLLMMGLMFTFSALNATSSFADVDNTKLVEEVKHDALNYTTNLQNTIKDQENVNTEDSIKSNGTQQTEKVNTENTENTEKEDKEYQEDKKDSTKEDLTEGFEDSKELLKKPAEVKAVKRADVKKITSSSKYETATNIRNEYFSKSNTVILTNSSTFVDSLSAVSLSRGNTPILFTNQSSLDSKTLANLKSNKPKKVYILGGEKSVSNSVVNQLKSLGIIVERIAGHDRYEVNSKVAAKTHNPNTKQKTNILITSGENHSDAISSAVLAQNKKAPILFVRKNEVPTSIKGYLLSLKRNNAIGSITIVGGNLSVSQKVESYLRTFSNNVSRIAGRDRYTTNVKVAKQVNPNAKRVIVAEGNGYNDALLMSPVATKLNASLMLTKPNDVTRTKDYSSNDKSSTMEAFFKNNKSIDQVIVCEGNHSISDFVSSSIADLLAGKNLKTAPKADALYKKEKAELRKSTIEKSKKVKKPVDSLQAQLAKAKRVFTVRSTAYTSDPRENGGWNVTAIGTKIRRGVIAVDPRVIPLRTRVYVEGYGFATAEDTGGAIKGNKIDVVMDTRAQSRNWGVRNVKIYIL